ncbi:MAG: hypothetical protein R3B48_01750 [Kofleriaceae bacterium]
MIDKRLLAAALMFAATGATSCGVDAVDTSVNKELCHTDVTITGTMVPAAKPADYDPELGDTNCWPVGEWTFTASPRATNEDGSTQCPSTDLLAEYKVKVERDFVNDDLDTYTFVTNPNAKARMKVSSGGGGLCEGVFEFYSDNGMVLHNLHPALQPAPSAGANHPLTGHGEFHMYDTDQWVP